MKPSFKLLGFDHVTFAVGNAKQAAHYYQSVYGFDLVGYRGLEQGDRQTASYVLQQNHVTFVLNTPYQAKSPLNDLAQRSTATASPTSPSRWTTRRRRGSTPPQHGAKIGLRAAHHAGRQAARWCSPAFTPTAT